MTVDDVPYLGYVFGTVAALTYMCSSWKLDEEHRDGLGRFGARPQRAPTSGSGSNGSGYPIPSFKESSATFQRET
jgi:hypothetical protein